MSSASPWGINKWVWRIDGSCDREMRNYSGANVYQCHCGTSYLIWTALVLNPKLFCEYCRIDEWIWRIGGSCDREIKLFFSGEKSPSVPLWHHRSYMDCSGIEPKAFL